MSVPYEFPTVLKWWKELLQLHLQMIDSHNRSRRQPQVLKPNLLLLQSRSSGGSENVAMHWNVTRWMRMALFNHRTFRAVCAGRKRSVHLPDQNRSAMRAINADA